MRTTFLGILGVLLLCGENAAAQNYPFERLKFLSPEAVSMELYDYVEAVSQAANSKDLSLLDADYWQQMHYELIGFLHSYPYPFAGDSLWENLFEKDSHSGVSLASRIYEGLLADSNRIDQKWNHPCDEIASKLFSTPATERLKPIDSEFEFILQKLSNAGDRPMDVGELHYLFSWAQRVEQWKIISKVELGQSPPNLEMRKDVDEALTRAMDISNKEDLRLHLINLSYVQNLELRRAAALSEPERLEWAKKELAQADQELKSDPLPEVIKDHANWKKKTVDLILHANGTVSQRMSIPSP